MKLIVKEKGDCAKAVKIECTITEYLVLNEAMKKYVSIDNNEIRDIDRLIMCRMLEVEPTFEEVSE